MAPRVGGLGVTVAVLRYFAPARRGRHAAPRRSPLRSLRRVRVALPHVRVPVALPHVRMRVALPHVRVPVALPHVRVRVALPHVRARVAVPLAVSVLLIAARLHGLDASASFASAGGPRPPAGVEENPTPLGTPPAVLPAAEGVGYKFLHRQADGVKPVAWSPCRPIHYVTRLAHQPPGGAKLVREAFADVSRATGLVFVSDGTTKEAPSAHRAPYQPDRYGQRWAPVLVSWSGADEVPDLASDVIGEAGAMSVRTPSGDRAFVTGIVNLDFAQMSDAGARGRYDETRAVVLHELGHLVGLDHVNDPVQVMFPSKGYVPVDYATGDRAGLAALGRGACQPDI